MLEGFRTGGLTQRRANLIGLAVARWLIALGLVCIGSWLLSWHFVRAMGLFLIVCAATIHPKR